MLLPTLRFLPVRSNPTLRTSTSMRLLVQEYICRSPRESLCPVALLNALYVNPPFCEYHFIDLEPSRTRNLRSMVGDRADVKIHHGDCNTILLKEVFPRVRYEDYRRALCLLDPYGLHLNWDVIKTAGQMKTIDMFLNFPVSDMNRNVLWHNPEGVREEDIQRMSAFWGDESWRHAAYSTEQDLFGPVSKKEDNDTIAEKFCERLKNIAGFSNVPEPPPMRNSREAIVYYLIFASQKAVASGIVLDIFKTYKTHRGA
jgi:three-Cys-motif partner protein